MGKGSHEKTPELEALVMSGMSYFGQTIDLHGDIENSEVRSFCFALWMETREYKRREPDSDNKPS